MTNPKKHRYIPSFQARVPLISVLKAGSKNNNRQNPLYGNLLKITMLHYYGKLTLFLGKESPYNFTLQKLII